MKTNIKSRASVGIIGMPRSGTTIVASFINSLDRATIWSETHRMLTPKIMKTRYGNRVMDPDHDILEQVEQFAIDKNLMIYGTKDVFDRICSPTEVYAEYGDRYDMIFVMIRNPRKVWRSMKDLGHTSGLKMSEREFVYRYKEFLNFCSDYNNALPIVMEKFIESPIEYMSKKMDIEITGPVRLKKFTGTGDIHATATGISIRKRSLRPEDNSPGLRKVYDAYIRYQQGA